MSHRCVQRLRRLIHVVSGPISRLYGGFESPWRSQLPRTAQHDLRSPKSIHAIRHGLTSSGETLNPLSDVAKVFDHSIQFPRWVEDVARHLPRPAIAAAGFA
jgi:hypothetical protein